MNNIVTFDNKQISVIEYNNEKWLSSVDIAKVLNFAKPNAVTKIYINHKQEFEDGLSCLPKLGKPRCFNREGAWLIGMFARTPKAVEFRKWVLKVLGAVADTPKAGVEVAVREHTRSLPSGKKEIVLSDKAKTEIGGIVKSCLGAQPVRFNEKELANRIIAMMTSFNLLAEQDKLLREAKELRHQAELREKQAQSFAEASDAIERAAA